MSRGPESEELNSTTTSSSEADYSGTASVCSEDHEDNDIVGTAERLLTREGSRKLIKPDLLAMSQLLNFDEVSDVGRYECHSLYSQVTTSRGWLPSRYQYRTWIRSFLGLTQAGAAIGMVPPSLYRMVPVPVASTSYR